MADSRLWMAESDQQCDRSRRCHPILLSWFNSLPRTMTVKAVSIPTRPSARRAFSPKAHRRRFLSLKLLLRTLSGRPHTRLPHLTYQTKNVTTCGTRIWNTAFVEVHEGGNQLVWLHQDFVEENLLKGSTGITDSLLDSLLPSDLRELLDQEVLTSSKRTSPPTILHQSPKSLLISIPRFQAHTIDTLLSPSWKSAPSANRTHFLSRVDFSNPLVSMLS